MSGESRRANGYAVSRNLNSKLVPTTSLRCLGQAARKHPPDQIKRLAQSLEEWGFVLPVVTDPSGRVIAGWGMVLAARQLGLPEIPAVTLTDLTDSQLRSLRLALNRLGEDSHWDEGELAIEINEIFELEPDVDLTITGFTTGEIDLLVGDRIEDEEDELAAVDENVAPVTRPGDVWCLGDHRILCGDALDPQSYEILLGGDRAEMIFSDPPWNLKIEGFVSGLGKKKHTDFQMASGEMSPEAFTAFLQTSFGHMAGNAVDGAIAFICMDWRHLGELLAASKVTFTELKNLVVWNKTNAGMGSLYRSKHELIFVFKSGKGRHINNVELGRFGRSRTNVWDYPGQNALNGTTKSKLSLHATAKPVSLVAGAIRDCSNRHGLVLDAFGGAGTTIIAAEKTGRKARLIEIEPRFVDVTVRRWQRLTGAAGTHATTDKAFGP